ncbi:MAG TPA: sigma-70 family RNA polymerase sigma factor [Stellaceae bacterium]|nr:sigma-70 family RNA polymerase sigma factor [Stellaceae bacterium]
MPSGPEANGLPRPEAKTTPPRPISLANCLRSRTLLMLNSLLGRWTLGRPGTPAGYSGFFVGFFRNLPDCPGINCAAGESYGRIGPQGGRLVEQARLRRFNEIAVPHLDAAYNLARWLTRNEHDAEDVVQEAYLRAFKFFDGYRGGDARAWILKIVRHTCFTWLARNRPAEVVARDDEEHEERTVAAQGAAPNDPETLLLQRLDSELLNRLIDKLSTPYREILVLREIEDLSYREIAEVLALPIGTVMSRLARAREKLQRAARGSVTPRLVK